MSISITKESLENHPAVQAFYATVNYHAVIQPDDFVISARQDGEIVGAVRLAYENGYTVLRGMMVAEKLQKQGVGSKLLKALEKEIGAVDCYCLPHEWLEKFYGQAGFIKIPDAELPTHLSVRLAEYRKKDYPHLVAMCRKCVKS